ncbi:hypothetical protein AcW1_002412 [Taiwanofungus camphoratus]|nr:hypothetical protein AcV5_009928 [Antrodia cinnamomea]KAI0943188.1 hypothetical protein AcW1_002412 [Antrodia cinnamomea]
MDTPVPPFEELFHQDYPIQTYVQPMERYAATSLPHCNEPTELTILARWPFFDFGWESNTSQDRRSVPSIMRHQAFRKADGVRLSATRALQTGNYNWSQVWEGNLSLSNEVSETRSATVVIKIYQESLMDLSEDDDAEMITATRVLSSSAKHAKTEAWAYTRMQSLQGKEIPWFYGFFKLQLAHGEVAFAQVMELVLGEQGTAISLENDPDDRIWQLADYIVSCIYEINRCGVLFGDVKDRNMIFTQDQLPAVVMIDFASSQEVNEENMANDLLAIFSVLKVMDARWTVIEAWYEARRQQRPPWATIFGHADRSKSRNWYERLYSYRIAQSKH